MNLKEKIIVTAVPFLLMASSAIAGEDIPEMQQNAYMSERMAHIMEVNPNLLNIQERLAMIGYYPSYLVNGKDHALMPDAIKQFQRDYGLKVDGMIGVETVTVLNYYTGTQHIMPIPDYKSVHYHAAPGYYADF